MMPRAAIGHRRRVQWAWPALGVVLLLLVVGLSLTPRPPHVPLGPHGDKLAHWIAYAVLMGYHAWLYPGRWMRMAWALFLVALGIALEGLQGWGGVRRFEYADMVADAAGVATGLGLVLLAVAVGGLPPSPFRTPALRPRRGRRV